MAIKNILPGDKFIDCADAAEKLYILIAQYINHLGPQKQAGDDHRRQDNPSVLFHSFLHFNSNLLPA